MSIYLSERTYRVQRGYEAIRAGDVIGSVGATELPHSEYNFRRVHSRRFSALIY